VHEVLRAAALLGVHFTVPDLAIVLARGVADLVSAIDEARTAGVLAEAGTGLRFRHPLIHTAMYEEIPAPVRAAWHHDAAHALAEAGSSADRVARQLLQAVGELGASMHDWVLTWLERNVDLLLGQAPQVAAELLRQAVAISPAGSAQHGFLASRLADALYRVGNAAEAEHVVTRTLAHATDPDLLADLHWTLAQCRMRAGKFAESLDTLGEALASPGTSARYRARLLVLVARTHSVRGDVEEARQVAEAALQVASEADDTWAMGWALHVLTIVAGVRGHTTDALPLLERALTVTAADPALTDLRVLLQINMAVVLGNLDRYDEALTSARQALSLADQVGTVIRQVQAHSALGELLFDTGRWAEAMAEVKALHDEVKEPMAACCDLGIAAVICFHRGELATARRYLAAAAPYAERIGGQVIGALVLARSLEPRARGRACRRARRADSRVRRKPQRTRRDRGPPARCRPPRA
jgi:tetratricopeptide (TPR) repeat protein